MKVKLIFLLTVVVCLRLSSQTNKEIDVSLMEQKSFRGYSKSLLSAVINNYNLKYHRCEWQVDPAVRYIKGKITSYFKPTVTGFNMMEFDLTDTLTVDSVKY